jgi:hypothetical protein
MIAARKIIEDRVEADERKVRRSSTGKAVAAVIGQGRELRPWMVIGVGSRVVPPWGRATPEVSNDTCLRVTKPALRRATAPSDQMWKVSGQWPFCS